MVQTNDGIRNAGMEGGHMIGSGFEAPGDAPDKNIIAMGQTGIDFWKQ